MLKIIAGATLLISAASHATHISCPQHYNWDKLTQHMSTENQNLLLNHYSCIEGYKSSCQSAQRIIDTMRKETIFLCNCYHHDKDSCSDLKDKSRWIYNPKTFWLK